MMEASFKKSLIALTLTGLIVLSPHTSAGGIPAFDAIAAALQETNALAQAQQAMEALKQAKEGIEQAREQYEAGRALIEGNSNLGSFLDNDQLNKVFPFKQWGDLYSDGKDLADLRERYHMKSSNAQVQKTFDEMLAAMGALEDNYDASTERVKNASEIRKLLNTANTPQQKQDLQLRYQQEYLELQNQQMRMQNMQMLAAQKEKLESKQKAQSFEDYIRGNSNKLPTSE